MTSMAWAMDDQSPERVPGRIPAPRPAVERSWQGDPPVMMSTGSTAAQSTAVTSPRLGTSGQWWARMRAGAWSISATQARRASGKTSATASSSPPEPANMAPTVGAGSLLDLMLHLCVLRWCAAS